ncbi:TonB-dependent receptor [Stenotrophomonas maltophilia]|uniref:TonB-dependent receptor n=1 Tax=Stenotrophomonas maltophilia TaxID=40324 RepID=UPI000C26ABDD|nr:TonB-dependent receptor [Stenotrophomonas maltophilia]PJL58289.1 hypothetical protein B9Y82_05965 [Stenotrophomonas maltophilia]
MHSPALADLDGLGSGSGFPLLASYLDCTGRMALYPLSSNVSAAVNINNLFDRHYYSQIGFYNQGWYGAPRNVMFTLKVGC